MRPKHAVLCFGRFQPVTRAHMKMFETADQYAGKYGDKFIFTSKTLDPTTNPLPYYQKVAMLQKATQYYSGDGFSILSAKDPFAAICNLAQDYHYVTLVCGQDRLKKFEDFRKYVKHPDPDKAIPGVIEKVSAPLRRARPQFRIT